MTTVIKTIVDDLLKVDIQYPEVFGNLISKYLFKDGESALVINGQRTYLLVRKTATDSFVHSKILLLLELIAVFESLQKSHDILVLNPVGDSISVYYDGKEQLTSIAHDIYKLSDNQVLTLEIHNQISINKNSSPLLSKAIELTSLQTEFTKYMSSVILPTSGLRKFKENGYVDNEIFLNMRSLKVSRFSVIVAIILALLSPIISIVLSNAFSHSTIQESQFQQIVETIQTSKIIHCDPNLIE